MGFYLLAESRLITRIHEAGHLVMATMCGVPVKKVYLKKQQLPGSCLSCGYVQIKLLDNPSDGALEALMLANLSGHAAVAGRRVSRCRWPVDSDLKTTLTLLLDRFYYSDAYFLGTKQQKNAFIDRELKRRQQLALRFFRQRRVQEAVRQTEKRLRQRRNFNKRQIRPIRVELKRSLRRERKTLRATLKKFYKKNPHLNRNMPKVAD